MTSDFTPRIYGKYYLIDRIAVGGMAEVYAARSFSTGGFAKTLVIKRILERYSNDPAFVSMFIDEAKISVGLQHGNVVQVYDFGKIKDSYYLAMEWVDGRDIKRLFSKLSKRKEVMPVDFALYIAHEACKALQYAHNLSDLSGTPMGIVHQDISPSNLVLSFNGQVKVVDFGIAATQALTNEAKDGINWGKVQYVAPERLRSKRATPRSDLFSMGVVLHEMLTGRGLFRAREPKQSARRILAGDYPPPSAFNPNVSPELDRTIARALALDPKDRFVDAGDMQEALFAHMDQRNPQLVQRSISLLMQELFGEERKIQMARLEHGSQVAQEFHETLGDVFDAEDRLGNRGIVPLGPELLAALGRKASDPTDVPMAPGVEPVAPTTGTSGLPGGTGSHSGPMSGPMNGTFSGPMDTGSYRTQDTGDFRRPYSDARKPELRRPSVQGTRPELLEESSSSRVPLIAGGMAVLGACIVIIMVWLTQSPPTATEILVEEIRARVTPTQPAELLQERGWKYLQQGSVEADKRAMAQLEEGAAASPESAPILAGLAVAYARAAPDRPALGPRAWTLLEEAERLAPQDPHNLAARAELALTEGTPKAALRSAKACEESPEVGPFCSLLTWKARSKEEAHSPRELLPLEGSAADGPELQRLLALADLQAGQVNTAITRLEKHEDLRTRLALAEILMQASANERALALIDAEAQEGQPDAALLAAEIHLLRGQPQRSMRSLTPLLDDPGLRLWPHASAAHILASTASLAIEDERAAMEHANAAFELSPNWAPAQLSLGRAAQVGQDSAGMDRAISGLDVLDLSPWHQAKVQLGVSELALSLERPRYAIMALELGLDATPEWLDLHLALSILRSADGDLAGADAQLANAWSYSSTALAGALIPTESPTSPSEPTPTQAAAFCLSAGGCSDWREIQTPSPYWQARLALLHDEPAMALQALPDSPVTWMHAWALSSLNDPGAEAAWQAAPQDDRTALARAEWAWEGGSKDEVQSYAQACLLIDPNNPSALALLVAAR
ncbi:MAG: serine/threonine protein kinase [Cognaticolwellia sp.]|jgi:serine/threonine protein kinase